MIKATSYFSQSLEGILKYVSDIRENIRTTTLRYLLSTLILRFRLVPSVSDNFKIGVGDLLLANSGFYLSSF